MPLAMSSHRGTGFSLPGPSVRYGSAERRSQASDQGQNNDRERDRDRGRQRARSHSIVADPIRQAQAYRNIPSGPQEEQDWTHALDQVMSKIASLEVNMRNTAQLVAMHTSQLNEHERKLNQETARTDWLHTHTNGWNNDYSKKLDLIAENVMSQREIASVDAVKINALEQQLNQLRDVCNMAVHEIAAERAQSQAQARPVLPSPVP